MKKNSMKKALSTIALALVLAVSFLVTPIQASAKVTYTDSGSSSKRYYSDVKTKAQYRADIEWLAKKGAFKGIAKKGGKFNPNKTITRRQVGQILDNLYGNRINLTITKSKNKANQRFITDTLTEVSRQLGYKLPWKGGTPKATVSRAKCANYIRTMIKYGKGVLNPS